MNKDVTIALAGALMALKVINQLANTGNYNRYDANVCFKSIFIRESENTIDIYNSLEDLTHGFDGLIDLKNSPSNMASINRYLYLLLMKTSLLNKNSQAKNKINELLDSFNDTEPDINNQEHINRIADLFVNHIRTIDSSVINIDGIKEVLTDSDNVNFMRVMMFAAVRSLYLYIKLNGPISANIEQFIDLAKVANIAKGN